MGEKYRGTCYRENSGDLSGVKSEESGVLS